MNKYHVCGLVATLLCAISATAQNIISFTMPEDGYATVAINDSEGNRIRNLFGELPFKKGEHSIEWDGRDDTGTLMKPGTYTWTGLHRSELKALYRGAFQHGTPPWLYGTTGAWTSDHGSVEAIVNANGTMLLGSLEAEWGHGLAGATAEGEKLWGIRWLERRAWCGAMSLAESEGRVFASSYPHECAIWEVDPLNGKNRLVLERGDIPEKELRSEKPELRLAGTVGEEIYISDLASSVTHVFTSPEVNARLQFVRTLPYRIWSITEIKGQRLVALDHSLAWLGEDSAPKPFTTAQISAPWCVVADGKGRIFVSDQGATGMHKFTPDGQLSYRYLRSEAPASHQIKIFDTDGKLLFTMGQKGGRSEGSYNVADFMQPAGLAFDNHGRLWVSEFSQTPKRVTVWNVGADSAEIAAEFLGPAMYGGAAAMIDKKRPWELLDINYGTMFNINLNTCSFNVKSIPHYPLDFWKDQGHMPEQPFSGRPGIIRQVGDRKLSMLSGGYMHGDDANWSPNRASASGLVGIGEYVGDRFMIRAAIGTISGWMRARSLMSRRDNPWLAAPFMEAAKRLPEWQEYAHRMGIEEDAQDVPHWEHKRGAPFFTAVRWPVEINGVIWIDSNGDCRVQPEEIEFFESGFGSSWTFDDSMNIYWHNDPKRYGGEGGTFVLPHTGFNETGAPLYRAQNIRKISNTLIDIYHIGSDGSLLEKAALRNNDGTLRWSYPWSPKGIRSLGKDSRKTLKPGSMWRISNVHGVVDVPGLGEVYAVHSIDGMKYFLTRDDGLFIGSLFKPYAFAPGWDEIPGAIPGTDLNDYSLQDECFNAHFVRSDETAYGFKKGAYYLLGMSRSAIVEVAGLDKVHRFKGGEFTLKADTGLFGREEYFDPAEAFVPTIAVRKTDPLRVMKSRPGIDIFRGKAEDWMNNIARAGYDSRGIHFKIEVRGSKTSFKNSGEDITRLFTSGDCIDIQLQSPKLGTLRFVTAMSGDKPVTVRMRYNGALTDSAMLYRSGVGEVQVAEVNKVAQAKPSVRSIGGGGYVVQFCLPWQSLGFETMPAVGTVLPFEMGLGYSDETGTRTVTREFWRGGSGMVADLPTEAAPTKNWGKLVFEE